MRIYRLFLFLAFTATLTSHYPSSITVNAKLTKKVRVYSVDGKICFSFLKFKTVETDNTFLVRADYEAHPEKFFKKNRIYQITYGQGSLWNEFKQEIKIASNKDLERYPVHFMLEVERLK